MTSTGSDAAAGLAETEAEMSRIRLLLEGSRSFRMGAWRASSRPHSNWASETTGAMKRRGAALSWAAACILRGSKHW